MHKFYYKITDSTNTRAREYATEGGELPALFAADAQSGGRGRQGKSFYSPSDTGIYMSLLFDVTDEPPRSVVALTTATATAVAESIENACCIKCGIKWVNDIYVGGKKVCGILCEQLSLGDKKYAIIGVGINLTTASFPEDIRNIAGSVGVNTDKTALTDSICKSISEVRERMGHGDFSYMDSYRRRSVVLGKEITFTQNGESFSGLAESINDLGGLHVKLPDGTHRTLESGEISLRLKEKL